MRNEIKKIKLNKINKGRYEMVLKEPNEKRVTLKIVKEINFWNPNLFFWNVYVDNKHIAEVVKLKMAKLILDSFIHWG